ncbi:glycoside hydrolase domain-containing protein [Parapedobacter sp.]
MMELRMLLCAMLWAFAQTVAAQANLQVHFVDPLQKVFPETNYFGDYLPEAHVARGEYATFQVALRAGGQLNGLKYTVRVPSFGNAGKVPAQVGYVDYVKVGRTYPDPAIDQLASVSGYYPDPIIDDKPLDLQPGETRSLWITVPIPHDARAGQYTLQLGLEGEGVDVSKTMAVTIHDVTLAPSGLWVTNWFSTSARRLKLLNNGEPVIPYSETYWKLIRVLARKMAAYGQNMALISPLDLAMYTEKNGRLQIDFSRFDRMVAIFQEEGVLGRIEGGHIGGRESTWDSQFQVRVPQIGKDTVIFEKVSIELPAAREFYRQFFTQLYGHLEEKGWKDIYYQHIADEPIESNIASYTAIAGFAKGIVPEMKVIEACHTKDLENSIDIWVPQLDFLHQDYEFYQQRQRAGDEAWFYTCLAPKGNYANRFLDLPLIKTRLLHWINFRFGLNGYLHWGLNMWNDDPFGETTGINEESGNVLPGGDSWVVYPGYHKLYSSIRLEAMRDGINDYALLKMLEAKDPALAKELVRTNVYRFDWYDTNPQHLRDLRKQVLEELSK